MKVYVTIADDMGKLVMTQEEVEVTDVDKDGVLTLHDALYLAHEENYEGGAKAGYDAEPTEFGISLTKLWGVRQGDSYGYYVNHTMAMGLADAIKEGDSINAFVYTDLDTWSDTYCYFEADRTMIEEQEGVTLTLLAAGYDEEFQPVTLPVKEAVITLNGSTTEYKTDTEGRVTVMMDTAGDYVVSAVSETQTLVPPVLKLSVKENTDLGELGAPVTGDSQSGFVYAMMMLGLVGFAIKRKWKFKGIGYEK